MTTPRIKAIGYCANDTEPGEWAFSLALDMASRHRLQLNIFQFVSDPYRDGDGADPEVTAADRNAVDLVEMEKRLRLHYDDLLGEYTDVGFRLCEDNEWTELHRCLCKQEFQLLVMANPYPNTLFGKRTLVDFARNFVSPVVLVGPTAPTELSLNAPAKLVAYRVGLEKSPKKVTTTTETLPYHQL